MRRRGEWFGRGSSVVLGALASLAFCLGVVGSAGAVVLPDGRAYEMVSPPDKNGSDVIVQTGKTHVSSDDDAVTFSSLGGFGELRAGAFDAEYVSRRTGVPGTRGWASHGINPLGGSQTPVVSVVGGQVPSYLNAFTPDLSASVYQSWRALVDAPRVGDLTNLYRVSGLRDGGASVELLSDAVAEPLPGVPPFFKVFGQPHLQPSLVGASSDLSHVVFESRLNLTADALPQSDSCTSFGFFGCEMRVYENAGGVVRLVGRVPSSPDEVACDDVQGPACVAAPNSGSGIPTGTSPEKMVSRDGRRVFFQVPAEAPSGAIYLREDGVRTVRLAQDGVLWDASEDGSRAFFITAESQLAEDADGALDLYMYDRDAPADARLTLVSASSVNDGYIHTVIGASADGRSVYFVGAGQLVAGEPAADLNGLYVWRDGELAFIGEFQDSNEAFWNSPRTTPAFVSTAKTSRVTPDGRHLLFMTRIDAGFRGRGGFTGYEHAGYRELYLYSADSGRLACASCNPSGAPATADAMTAVALNTSTSVQTSKLSHALSDDGRRVFFSSAEALVPEDVNGVSDAYEYDAASGRVHLLSSGTDPAASYLIDASRSGDDAFFATRERLVGWDVDGSYDLYDARVNGGFPEPATAAQCQGEACLGQGSSAPADGRVASDAFRGAGNVKHKLKRDRKRCGRRAVRRVVRGKPRCVSRRALRRRALRRAARAGAGVGVRGERSGR